MISSVRGTILQKTSEYVVVDVGGIGFKVFVTSTTLGALGAVGDTATLMTHMYVREDNLSLYGFATDEERRMFELLLGVSGVGPKMAIGILSTAALDSLRVAIASGSTDTLTRVPGIGAKLAGRIVLELKGKIDPRSVAGREPELVATDPDVLAALTNLGYSVVEAQSAIRSLPTDASISTEEKILQALRYFAEQRG
ncbi:MAG: Holliday junction branch migration protein RuvA [Chloroflexi bacterium]|nr:Holliday junction branch migration protein RuvA [Chloroflexota bacterium]MDA8186516.1 Holliday junction branch migration protein RuvA [Dehalococcoidales bacterium]